MATYYAVNAGGVDNRSYLVNRIRRKEAILGWTKANKISPWFILSGDKCPSWFWVK